MSNNFLVFTCRVLYITYPYIGINEQIRTAQAAKESQEPTALNLSPPPPISYLSDEQVPIWVRILNDVQLGPDMG